jgi:hypothetical protein
MARMILATISPDNESKTKKHSYYSFRTAKENWNVAAVDPNGLQVSREFNFQLHHLNNRGSVPQFSLQYNNLCASAVTEPFTFHGVFS